MSDPWRKGAERAGVWGAELGRAGANAWSWARREVAAIVDLQRLTAAATWHERAAAVSWPRAGAAAASLVALCGALALYVLTRPDAYPPQDPSRRELAARREAVKGMPPPPKAMLEASQPWEAPR